MKALKGAIRVRSESLLLRQPHLLPPWFSALGLPSLPGSSRALQSYSIDKRAGQITYSPPLTHTFLKTQIIIQRACFYVFLFSLINTS